MRRSCAILEGTVMTCLEEGGRVTKHIKICGALPKIQNGYLRNTNQMLLE
jgi:hypothetical protein